MFGETPDMSWILTLLQPVTFIANIQVKVFSIMQTVGKIISSMQCPKIYKYGKAMYSYNLMR